MITYQIDKSSHQKLNNEIKDLYPVVAEIAPTLQTLMALINEHANTISSPTINSFRAEIQDLIVEAAALNRAIAGDVQKLVTVSEQAGRHLSSIDDHFGAVLRGNTTETTETAMVQA